ncbi:hypothetical protein FPG78_00870 [Cardinium endosymbiont of Dermatophagoides farinae]|nr:hypothetical protein FPG78_00870 [Cardinium endosymbiont of Dermatophagoides farinae]
MVDAMEGYMMVNLDLLYEKNKWKQILYKVRLLHDKEPIQNILHIITYDGHSSVRFKRIDAHANLTDHVAATDSIDEAIPNWTDYGITSSMRYKRSSFGDKQHTFSLDLNGVTFQNGDQLGFILMQNNNSPVDLIKYKYLVKKEIPWPDEPDTYTHIQDGLILPGTILPGTIGNPILQSAAVFNATIDLTSYTTIYCYIKRGITIALFH